MPADSFYCITTFLRFFPYDHTGCHFILYAVKNLRLVFSLVRELLDALLVFKAAYEQLVIVLCHDIAVEADDHDLPLLHGVYHTATALVERDVLAYGHVACEVLIHLHMQRSPGAEVAPSEVGGEDVVQYLAFLI